jgi:hypothetical protein
MASVEELIIKLSADNSDLKKKLAESEKSVGGLGKAVGTIGPMIAGAFTIGAITAFGKAAFTAFEEQEKMNKKLLSSLQGNGFAFKELTKQAEQLRSKTGVDDGAIMQIQQLGAGAGYSVDKIKKLTDASVQLAAKTGQDLQSAYMQINATFTGSAGRLTRLDSDFGLLTETQLKNGDAVDLILNKYGTFAQDTASQTDILKSNFDELQESIGYAFAEGSFMPALKIINKMILASSELVTVFGKFGGSVDNYRTSQEAETGTDIAFAKFKKNADERSKLEKDWTDKAKVRLSQTLAKQEELLKGIIKEREEIIKTQKITDTSVIDKKYDSKIIYQKSFIENTKNELAYLDNVNVKNESGIKTTEKQITSLEKYIKAMEAAYKKAQELESFNVPVPSFSESAGGIKDITGVKGKGITQKGDPSKLLSRGQTQLGEAVKKTNSELELQATKMQSINETMAGFGQAAAMAFGEQSQAAKAFAIGSILASTAMAIMGTWAGYGKYGFMGTGLAIAQTAMIASLGAAQIAGVAGAFAMGGIVGGGSYSGDQLTARVNSGEMILNGNQQRELFAMANGMGGRNQVEVVGYISGDVIRLANKRSEYILNRRG